MPTFPHTAKLSQPDHYRRMFDSPKYKVSGSAISSPCNTRRDAVVQTGCCGRQKKHSPRRGRNRIKRLVREQFRHHPFEAAMDLVVLARSGADQMDNPSVWQELERLWRTLEQKVNS